MTEKNNNSFSGHFVELRSRLIKSLLFILVVFIISYTFAQDDIVYYQSHMLDKINSDDFKEITFTSLNYHRPPTDSCGLSKLDRSKFYIDCQLLDGVKASLRGQEIWINYLSECNIQKLNS